MRATILVLLVLGACSSTHRDVHPDEDASSGGSGALDSGADAGGAGSGGKLGTFVCGGKACNGATSYCLSFGGAGGGFASCNPIPTACGGVPDCACLEGAGIGSCSCHFDAGGFVLDCQSSSG